MEDNKDLEEEKKAKVAKKTTTKKAGTTSRKKATTSTAKKTTTKASTTKTTAKTTKKSTKKEESSPKTEKETTKKTTTRKKSATKKKEDTPAVEKIVEKKEIIHDETIDPMADFLKDDEDEIELSPILYNKNDIQEETNNEEEIEEKQPEVEINKEKIEDEQPIAEVHRFAEMQDTPSYSTTNKTSEEPAKEKQAPKKVEKKKKKHSGLKAILTIIIIILLVFLVHFARNYVIIDSILARRENIDSITNYSYKMTSNNGATLEYYHKDNVVMLVKEANNEKTLMWSDKNTKEVININLTNLTAKVSNDGLDESSYNINPTGIASNLAQSRGYDFMYLITTDTVNGKECYVVTKLFGGPKSWYDKEDGTLLKYEAKEGEAEEYTDWKLNELTDEDVTKPNLIGYTIEQTANETENEDINIDYNIPVNDINTNQVSENSIDENETIDVNQVN